MPVKNKTIVDQSNSQPETTRQRARSKGQALLIVALMMSLLVMFVGLAVDVGNLMGKRAKLQSAVDVSALSAAQMLVASIPVSATVKADQMMETNGIPAARSVTQVEYPAPNQVLVRATWDVDTFFMRIVPAWRTVRISAEATVDINSYAEMNTKPFGYPGVVSELNLMVWGVDSWRRGGDAFSPRFDGNNGGVGITNPLYVQQPYGYLYRIDVPANYTNDFVTVEIWDPDSYNKPASETPPAFPTPQPPCSPPCVPPPTPTFTADMYARCGDPNYRPASAGACTSNASAADPGMHLLAYPNQRDVRNRTAFWRADEYRTPYNDPCGICGQYQSPPSTNATQTRFRIYHFNPRITSAFGDPAVLSDYTSGGNPYIAEYIVRDDATKDLRWYQPPGFSVRLRGGGCTGDNGDCFEREPSPTGGWYFYLYVKGIAGSSENNMDLRVGPPQTVSCSNPAQRWCYVNTLYFDQCGVPCRSTGTAWPDWNDGGARIFAKRALPLNLDTGDSFPLTLAQISKNAAGQNLGIRHFDQDDNGGVGSPMTYQMQLCNPPPACVSLLDLACWGDVATGNVGPNNGWSSPGYPDPDRVRIPLEGTAQYTLFFGASGQCPSSWLRIKANPSYSGDSTVWEMPFIRPRLIK